MNNNPITTIIIEDNQNYLDSLQDAFERLDEVECVGGYKSVEAFQEAAPEAPDCLLLDINLPGLSGLDALPRLKQLLPSTDIVMLTQHDDYISVLTALRRGASGYIVKGGSITDIHQALLDVNNGAAVIDPRLSRIVLSTLLGTQSDPNKKPLLTLREVEVLGALADGLTKKGIAHNLDISYHTVDRHVRHIYEKLKAPNIAAAIATAIRKGII